MTTKGLTGDLFHTTGVCTEVPDLDSDKRLVNNDVSQVGLLVLLGLQFIASTSWLASESYKNWSCWSVEPEQP